MLDIDKIRQLVDMMMVNDLVEISLRDGDVEVSLRRPAPNTGAVTPVMAGAPFVGAGIPNVAAATAAPVAAETPAAKEDEPEVELVQIKSPMVGTFYTASDPDSPPYVQVGAVIHPDSVVCIVEAMKVFNEIKAEVAGTIEKVLVHNEKPVEYGQPLFLVRPE